MWWKKKLMMATAVVVRGAPDRRCRSDARRSWEMEASRESSDLVFQIRRNV